VTNPYSYPLKYEGYFFEDLKHGLGLQLNSETGDYYYGMWENGKEQGIGR
jgi:hypothetical protein